VIAPDNSPPPSSSPAASFALAVLVGLVVLSPWAFGGVQPAAVGAITVTALLACAIALAWDSADGGARLPAGLGLPLAGLLALGLLQLLPLPARALAVIAPGSHDVWFPESAAARAVIGGAAHPISVHPVATLRALLLASGLGGLALVAAPALARVPQAARAAWAVTVSATAVAVYGVVARARFGHLLYGTFPVPTVNPFGPFVSKNHFAGYVGMAALLALGLAAAGGRKRSRAGAPPAAVAVAVVAALAMVLAVLVSLSRGGALSLACGVLAFIALRLRDHAGAGRRARWLPTTLVTAALAGLAIFAMPPEAQGRLRELTGTSFRVDTWRDTLRLAAASPWVGQGLGSFADAYPRFKRGHGVLRVEHAENDYLETLAEAGLIGACLIAITAVRLARRGSSRGSSSPPRGLRAGALGGLVLLLVHSALDFNLRIPSNAALAALLASIVVAAAPSRVAATWTSRVAAAAFAAAALCALPWTGLPLDPAAAWEQARAQARRAAASVAPPARRLHLERTEQALRAVLRQRPAHAEGWLLLAGARAERDDPSAAELAGHAVLLDPERPDLRRTAALLAR
jgi:O-antigen ligase